MTYKNTRRGFTQKVVNKNCHPKFISGSTPLVTTQYKEEMLKQVQHDKGMGFTLIELLVVVLIIGILAAVAVPQYQKAVLKSRMSELLTLQKSVADAQRVYFLANGTYPEHFSQLDLDIDNLTASNDSQLSGSGLASNEDVARYNNFFQIVLGTEGNTSNIIKGKYKGCGFNINFKTGELICKEWYWYYKDPAGSFCHKIMGTGETFTTANNVRYFPM